MFATAFGEYDIKRLPVRQNDLLQGWNAADEYVLDYLASDNKLSSKEKILICNDSFGALAVALHQYQVSSWSDSFISHQATLLNYKSNELDTDHLQLIDSISQPDNHFSTIIIKVPKTLAFFEYQLIQLRLNLIQDCQIIVIGMVKNMPSKIWKLLEQHLGDTRTSLAKKKSRMIFVDVDKDIAASVNPL